jgi:hypothetical protein
MEIKESATYPYPIWGLHGSYLSDDPEKGLRNVVRDNEANVLKVHYEVTCHEPGIDRLIHEGKALYQCIVECPATYYLLHKEFSETTFDIDIPLEKVYKRCTVKIIIVAAQDIIGCDFLNLDETYNEPVDFDKGYVLAQIDDFTTSLLKSNSAADLSMILRVMFTDVQCVKYDFSGKRIIIKLPLDYSTRFNQVEDLCPGVIEASLVYQALVQAVFKLRESPDMTRDWVFYLTRYLHELNEDDTINLRDDSFELELDDIFIVVDKLLDNPALRAIDDTSKQIQ